MKNADVQAYLIYNTDEHGVSDVRTCLVKRLICVYTSHVVIGQQIAYELCGSWVQVPVR